MFNFYCTICKLKISTTLHIAYLNTKYIHRNNYLAKYVSLYFETLILNKAFKIVFE